MASPSKEENMLQAILEESPLKQWSFTELMMRARVTRAVANKWLRKYSREGLLNKERSRGHYPRYSAGERNAVYLSRKKIFILQKIHDSGLFQKLLTLPGAKTIIIFGSAIKGDWYKHSDVDVFLYGTTKKFDRISYEKKLGRKIEIHRFENKKDLKDVKTGLLENVIDGLVVKGTIKDVLETKA